jgi:hypothetical protein
MEERNSKEQPRIGRGECNCKPFDPPKENKGDSIRRLLTTLEEKLEEIEIKRPTDATKKFGDDLKDANKEYQGIGDIVSKYEKFYDQLGCRLAEAKNWMKDIDIWSHDEPVDEKAIQKLREEQYEKEEKDGGKCCRWLGFRDSLNLQQDCLARAVRAEEEAKDDNEAYKGFEKTVTDQFTDLKSLRDKAETYWKAEKYQSVFAVSLEFDDVYGHLGTVITWKYQRDRCKPKVSMPPTAPTKAEYSQQIQSGYQHEQKPEKTAEERLWTQEDPWTPEEFRARLTKALHDLILTKYQRFSWQQQRLELELDAKAYKDACDKFRKSRRDNFIQEAQDVPPPKSGAGTAKTEVEMV